jgi:AcrR family transcriptional regulator
MDGTGVDTGLFPKPLRADAERNRKLILDTAVRVFAERGLEATLNDIAHEAGLGVGTVYRRFADKDELIAALFESKFAMLHDLALRAETATDAGQGLRQYLMAAAEARAADRGLMQVLARATVHGPRSEDGRVRLTLEVERLVARARLAGAVREDFTAADVPILFLMIGAVADLTHDASPDVWRRYAQLLIDGLRPGAECPELCVPPLDMDGILLAMGNAKV